MKYLFTWPDIKLHAEVSRIAMNHDATKCIVVFTSSHEKANPHILQTRLNLESARSRNELAKDLATRYKLADGLDWRALTEYMAIKSLREYEKGEPVIDITSDDETAPLEYLVHPVAPLLKPTVLFGEPGTGKSQIALILTIAMLLPWRDNPLKLGVPATSSPALFLDYESDPDDIRRQLVSLCHGMNLPYIHLHYRRCSLPIASDLESIRDHVEALNAKCLIIDSTSLAAGDDLNKMSAATAYFRALRQLNITTISLAHTSKEKDSKTKTILGSILWEAGARSVWEVRGEEDDDALDIALFHRKSNLSRRFGPQGYRISYENDLPVCVSWQNPKDVAEFVERMSTNDRVLDLLKGGATDVDTMASVLELNRNAITVSLHRLKKKELVTKLPDQKWGLTTYGEG